MAHLGCAGSVDGDVPASVHEVRIDEPFAGGRLTESEYVSNLGARRGHGCQLWIGELLGDFGGFLRLDGQHGSLGFGPLRGDGGLELLLQQGALL